MAPKRSTCFAALAAGEATVARPLRSSFTQQRPRRVMLFEQHVMPNVLHMPLAGSVGLQSRDETAAGTTVAMLGAGSSFWRRRPSWPALPCPILPPRRRSPVGSCR